MDIEALDLPDLLQLRDELSAAIQRASRKIDIDALRELAAQRLTGVEIARRFGVSPGVVCQAAQRHGIRMLTQAEANADPEVKARRSAAIREAWADPEVKARRKAAMKAARNRHLAHLTDAQRDDYRVLRKARYSMAEALAAVEGRR